MAEPGAAFELELAEVLFDDIGVGGVRRPRVHLGQVVLDVDEEAPQRRGDPGARGHDDGGDVEFLRHVRTVQRSRTAEGDEGEVARVEAPADRDEANGVGHVGVGDLDDGVGRRIGAESQRSRDRGLDRRLRTRPVEGHLAVGEIGAEPSEPEVGIGVRRFRAAASVAGRARVGTGRLRTVAQGSRDVDVRQ